MASKRNSAKTPKKKPAKSKKAEPQIGVVLDERKRKAVGVLAYAGYRRGEKCRSGAITNAARQAGCDRNTIYAWLEDPEFLEAIDEAKEVVRLTCIDGLVRGAKRMNVAACIATLKIIEPEVYDEQHRRDAQKHEYAVAMEELKHRHRMEEMELRARHGMPEEDDFEEPDFSFRETAPGERLNPEDLKKKYEKDLEQLQ